MRYQLRTETRKGSPGRSRTDDLVVRNHALCPTELQGIIQFAPSAGLEPATVGIEARCAIQLRHEGLVGVDGGD